jgi:hypothetical protein
MRDRESEVESLESGVGSDTSQSCRFFERNVGRYLPNEATFSLNVFYVVIGGESAFK